MHKAHVITIAVLLGLASIFGLVAAVKTAHLGAAAQAKPSATAIAARERTLNQTERALRRALDNKPPALPAARVRAPQQVIVRRPAPLIVATHHRGGEHEVEAEHEGGDD